MTITIGTLSFDSVEYDADADVLYLSVGEPRMPAESFGTPEGQNIRCDETGAVIAITIVNAKPSMGADECAQTPKFRPFSPASNKGRG
jgi:uncharacterized protein YuzE